MSHRDIEMSQWDIAINFITHPSVHSVNCDHCDYDCHNVYMFCWYGTCGQPIRHQLSNDVEVRQCWKSADKNVGRQKNRPISCQTTDFCRPIFVIHVTSTLVWWLRNKDPCGWDKCKDDSHWCNEGSLGTGTRETGLQEKLSAMGYRSKRRFWLP